MAIVTGLTADRMQEIIDATVVDADVVADHLILTLHDGSTIDAGIVKGDPGTPGAPGDPGATGPSGITVCISSTRPATPYDGQQIYETDTYKTLIWYAGKPGWFPIWNTAWGILGRHRLIVDSPIYTVAGNSDMVTTFVGRTDRHYRVSLNTNVYMTTSGFWLGNYTLNGTVIGRAFNSADDGIVGEHYSASMEFSVSSNATHTMRLQLAELSGTTGFQLPADSTTPRSLWVEDIGPKVA